MKVTRVRLIYNRIHDAYSVHMEFGEYKGYSTPCMSYIDCCKFRDLLAEEEFELEFDQAGRFIEVFLARGREREDVCGSGE